MRGYEDTRSGGPGGKEEASHPPSQLLEPVHHDYGAVIGETSEAAPVVAARFDRSLIERAKAEYPRYVKDLTV